MITKYRIDGNPISKLPKADVIEFDDLLNIDRHLGVMLSDFIFDDYIIETDATDMSVALKRHSVTNIIKSDSDPSNVINVSAIMPTDIKPNDQFYLKFRSVDIPPSTYIELFNLSCYVQNDTTYEYFDDVNLRNIALFDGSCIKFRYNLFNGFTVEQCTSSDLSILTKFDLLSYGIILDADIDDELQITANYQITYKDLVKNIVSTYLDRYKLNTMAYKDFWEYSYRNHEHPYNALSIVPAYNTGIALGTVTTVNADLLIDSTLYVPQLDDISFSIGEIKFIATNTISSRELIIDSIKNHTFDGWVYPDGTEYSKFQDGYDFTEAFEMYANSNQTTSFNVPILSSFFKANNNTDATLSSQIQLHSHETQLQSHTHSIDTISSSKFKLKTLFKLPLFRLDSDSTVLMPNDNKYKNVTVLKTLLHIGKLSAKVWKSTTTRFNKNMRAAINTHNISLDTNNLSTSIVGTDLETYPTYNDLPVMIYIGTKLIL